MRHGRRSSTKRFARRRPRSIRTRRRSASPRRATDGLTSQASQQRDRALRKTDDGAAAVDGPGRRGDDLEFEDARRRDNAGSRRRFSRRRTAPARRPTFRSAEDDQSSPAGGYLAGGMPADSSRGCRRRCARRRRPADRTSTPGRRIPTPSSDFLPAPAGGFGSGAHYPSIAIPAPSAQDSSARAAAPLVDNRLRLPAVGLVGFLVTAFAAGCSSARSSGAATPSWRRCRCRW